MEKPKARPKRLFKNYKRPAPVSKSLAGVKTVLKSDSSGREYEVREWDGKPVIRVAKAAGLGPVDVDIAVGGTYD